MRDRDESHQTLLEYKGTVQVRHFATSDLPMQREWRHPHQKRDVVDMYK